MSDMVPFGERGDEDSVDDLLGLLADAAEMQQEENNSNVVNELVGNIFKAQGEDGGILGNFILIGEVINADGEANLMVVTSEGLPEWVARGMIMTADDYIAGDFIVGGPLE